MLNALIQADLVDVTAVVTRYFGGIKLGAGGLTRAYGGCVTAAVASVPRVVREIRQIWRVDLSHADAGRIQEELLRSGATQVGISYDDMGVHLRFTYSDAPVELVSRITQGVIVPIPDGTQTVELPIQ